MADGQNVVRGGQIARGAIIALLCGASLAGFLTPDTARAGEAQDQLFATGALGDVATGEVLVYEFERTGGFPTEKLGKVTAGAAKLTLAAGTDGGPRTALAEIEDGGRHAYDPFPAEAGNPMFMVFMEEAVESMAKLTGGSPFYIRNRMREALSAQDSVTPVEVEYGGAKVQARELAFQPFTGDKNADRMGAFSDLTIRFVMSDAVPGEFARMEAVTGPGPDGAPFMRMSLDLDKVEKES